MTEKGKHRVCPWYGAYLFDNPLRKLAHDPERIFSPWVKPGMTALDVGCGMGYFSLGLARLVGPGGQVHALDIQPQMLRVLTKRARRAGLTDTITTHLIGDDGFNLEHTAHFANAFWMVHEVPDQEEFFLTMARHLADGAYMLVAEPGGHVTQEELEKSVKIAAAAGLKDAGRPQVRLSRSVVLRKA
jgi:ubiquinone/menaquinone biosynthesis C-methylase UbiE